MSHRGFVSGMQLLSFPPSTLPTFLVVPGRSLSNCSFSGIIDLLYYAIIKRRGKGREGKGEGKRGEWEGEGAIIILWH